MIVYVLFATWPGADLVPDEVYLFHGDHAELRAELHALRLIQEYVGGNWTGYRLSAVRKLQSLINDRRFQQARDHWNSMSSYSLSIEQHEVSETDELPDIPDFGWPDDE